MGAATHPYKEDEIGIIPVGLGESGTARSAYGNISKYNMDQKAPIITKSKCPGCDEPLDVPTDASEGEIFSCPGCGLELEVKKVNRSNGGISYDLQELSIEGEDWGE